MKRKVYTDGNGGTSVIIEGLGIYYSKAELSALTTDYVKQLDELSQANYEYRFQNNVLKAQVENFRDLLIRAVKGEQYIIESDLIAAIDSDLQSEISEAIDATPSQCLAEIKAQAVEGFYKALMRSPNISVTGKEIISGIWLCSPVRELSQQAKAGK